MASTSNRLWWRNILEGVASIQDFVPKHPVRVWLRSGAGLWVTVGDRMTAEDAEELVEMIREQEFEKLVAIPSIDFTHRAWLVWPEWKVEREDLEVIREEMERAGLTEQVATQ